MDKKEIEQEKKPDSRLKRFGKKLIMVIVLTLSGLAAVFIVCMVFQDKSIREFHESETSWFINMLVTAILAATFTVLGVKGRWW